MNNFEWTDWLGNKRLRNRLKLVMSIFIKKYKYVVSTGIIYIAAASQLYIKVNYRLFINRASENKR